MKEMIARGHHALVDVSARDGIHANDAIGTRGDVAHLHVGGVESRRRAFRFFVGNAALRENFYGNLSVTIVHLREESIGESVPRIDEVLREQRRRLRHRPRD